MRINPPKKKVFWLSVILGVAGIVGYLVAVFAGISWMLNVAFWVALGGLVFLVLGNVLRHF
jgi:zinc transporter ZupT